MTFDEMRAKRDPLYAANPVGEFAKALRGDTLAKEIPQDASLWLSYRNTALLRLAVRALRNQGELCYPSAKES